MFGLVRTLLPSRRWAQVALLALLVFTLVRSVLWASVQPAWLAPDEDYHFLYVNYLVQEHTVPRLDRPFYTADFYRGVVLTRQQAYLGGPRTDYSGSPHAVLRRLGPYPGEQRPAPPAPRPVLHPPGYYFGPAVIDALTTSKTSVTRLTLMRYWSALLGMVTVLLAYLLAAQVLAREWERLGVAAITATQPILAFSASTLTNDVAVAATSTLTLLVCMRILRGPPRARHGIWAGLALSAALFSKATTFSLVLVIALTLLLAWRAFPAATRELRRISAWTIGLPAVLVGWWYVRLLLVTGSLLGAKADLTASRSHTLALTHAFSLAWLWISNVYRAYWFDYNSYEVRGYDLWFWLPVVGIVIGAVGFTLLVWRERRALFSPVRPVLRQSLVLFAEALILLLPPFGLDVIRGLKQLPFDTQQGRFLTPAYPGLAVIVLLAVRQLTGRVRHAYPVSVAAMVLVSFVFYCHTWVVWVLERFYGALGGHFGRALYHASFDKPRFITEGSLMAMVLVALAAFLIAYAATIWGARATPQLRRGPEQARAPGALPTSTR